ncbi:MAG TPA: hypothetical protein VF783_18480 [Terriglobales bacterium]
MELKQVFKSAVDDSVISEIELPSDEQALIPAVGDNVQWFAQGKAYTGRVKSRLISYAPSHNAGLGADAVAVTAALTVELVK